MPRPLFTVSASLRLIDPAIYLAVVALYQFGSPVIHAMAPDTLAATYSAPLGVDPDFAAQNVLPATFVFTTTRTVLGQVVPTSVGAGTLTGVSYTDLNGVHWTEVDWEWVTSVEFYTGSGAGQFDLEIVTWTGDGSAGRLIPTTHDLTQGVVAIMVFPTVAAVSFRHSSMAGCITGGSFSAVAGVLALTATGFTVTSSGSFHVNDNLAKYTALVFRDTTPTNLYLHVGTYQGIGTINATHTTDGTDIVVGGITAADVGRLISYGGGVQVRTIIARIDATHYQVSAPVFVAPGATNAFSAATDRDIVAGSGPQDLIWVFGRSIAHKTTLHPAGGSSAWSTESKSLTDQITSLVFRVGTDNNVNNTALTYYWMALASSSAYAAFVQAFSCLGAGSTVVVPLTFTPDVVGAKTYLTTPASTQAAWRGPWNGGTTSQSFGGVADASLGIPAIGGASVSIGSHLATNGDTVYGVAFLAGTVTNTDYTPGTPSTTPPTVGGPNTLPIPASSGGNGCGSTIGPNA